MNTEALKAAREHNPRNPGKFEGESAATVYYWHCMLDGDGEYNGSDEADTSTAFTIEPDEAVEFGLNGDRYIIWESSDGFVYGVEN